MRAVFELIIPVNHNCSAESDTVLNSLFTRKEISRTYQLEGKALSDERITPLVGVYELLQGARRKLGLHGNEGHTYRLVREDIEFRIGKLKLWLYKSGIGFITFHIDAYEIEESHILDLTAELCAVQLKRKISYIQSTGKDTSEERIFTLKKIITDLLGLLGENCLYSIDDETYQKARCLFYGVGTVPSNEEKYIFLEMLRTQNKSNRTIPEYNKEKFYCPYTYITWTTSERVLAVFCDTEVASEKNREFITDSGGLLQSVFTNYMLIYLTVTASALKVRELEQQYKLLNITAIDQCPEDLRKDIAQYLNMPVISLSNENHINTLFDVYLYDRALGMKDKRELLAEINIGTSLSNQLKELQEETARARKTLENIDERTSRIERQLTEWMDYISELVSQRKSRIPEHTDCSPEYLEKFRSDFINSIAAEIVEIICKDTASVDYEETQLKGMFGESWDLLDEYTRRSLISAKVFVSNCRKTSYKTLDYSGIIVSVTSALENELKLRFFIGYQDYLLETIGRPSIGQWPRSMLFAKRNGQVVKNTEFTLGSLPYILECAGREKEILQNYLQTIMGTQYRNQGISCFHIQNSSGKSFVDRCEDVRNKYRNAAAHTEPVSMEQAEACCAEVIGWQDASNQIGKVQGLLFDLVGITENYKFWRNAK